MGGARGIFVAVGAGLVAGLIARVLFQVLPEPWGTLANTSALWGLVPFFVGLRIRPRGWSAGAVGILSLAVMVTTWAALSPTTTARELLMWAVVTLVAGALCGMAGSLVAAPRTWLHRAALVFMGGIVVGEALYGIALIQGPQWWFELAVGLSLPLALGRTWRDRLLSVLGASVIAGALFGAYLLYDAIALL